MVATASPIPIRLQGCRHYREGQRRLRCELRRGGIEVARRLACRVAVGWHRLLASSVGAHQGSTRGASMATRFEGRLCETGQMAAVTVEAGRIVAGEEHGAPQRTPGTPHPVPQTWIA